MKTLIIVISVIVLLFSGYSQTIGNRPNLKGPIQVSEEVQFQMLVKKIMNNYGKNFRYFNELQKGLFRFDIKDKEGYFLTILNKQGQVINSIRLYKDKLNNGYFLNYRQKEIEKYITTDIFPKLKDDPFKSDRIETIIERDNILWDRIIINVPEYHEFKVFNRSFAMEHLVYDHQFACPLYDLLADATIIPFRDNQNNFKPKVVSVDARHCSIVFGDQNVDLFSDEDGAKFYCSGGQGNNQLLYPTGISYGVPFESGEYEVYPVYVSDHNNGRIIKSNFKINQNGDEYPSFEENSFQIISTNVHCPYDVEYFDIERSTNDVLWVSEDYSTGALVSINSDGSINTKIKGFRYTYDGINWYIVPFESGRGMRIAIYKPMNCFAFIYRAPNGPFNNEICTFLLDNNGTPLSMYNDTIVNVWREHFNSDYPLTSVNFQNINNYSVLYPYMWITTGGFGPPSPYSNMVHAFAINSTANFGYLGSSGKPRGTDWYFHNLLNTVTGLGYYDLFTIEEWSDTYGLRQYYPFADFHSVEIKNYCEDSTNMLEWNAAFTNDCFIKFWVDRRKNALEWEPVEIKQIDGFNKPPGTYNPIIFRFKGYTALAEEDPIEIKLNLPLKDYVFGGQLRLQARLYPDYDPSGSGEYTETPLYYIDINRYCLPKPGGCPFLYVKDEDIDYTFDNNLLHKSEFSEGDITDMYKLQVSPYLDSRENKIELAIVENENDLGYINMVKLYAVDYPIEKKMAVAEGNYIALYDSAGVLASDSATLNDANVTQYINFHYPDTLLGYTTDSMYAHFINPDGRRIKRNINLGLSHKGINNNRENDNYGKEFRANGEGISKEGPGGPPAPIAFISKLGNLPTPVSANKTWAGYLTATSILSHEKSVYFPRRELSSVVVVPLFNDTDKVDHINIDWLSNFEMRYLGIAHMQYDGYTMTEAPMSEGKYITESSESNVLENLLYLDTLYSNVSSSGLIKMKFDVTNLPVVPGGYKREYVIEVNGRYERGTDIINKVQQQQIPLDFRLSQNYPNPFNPKTKINYEIPKTLKVSLIIYDILGREVKRLVNNEFKEAGRYTVEFDGTNFASGVYFYRIEAGTYIRAKKMVLVK